VKQVPEPWLTLLVTMLAVDPAARPSIETSRRLRVCARQIAAGTDVLQRVNVELNEPRHGACYWAPSTAGVPPRARASPARRVSHVRRRALGVALGLD
jgi:hypothetical protein